ncbi:MAG TPA: biopolymer transporter ExbD [Opitutaceae bacterium]|nr:biopolymer transporter ExbD [Opitutaceae bacterium]
MITRPLDLASKLRPEPRNFDLLFLVNGGLIALFFSLFGSGFVLAPGLTEDFRLPVMPGAREGGAPTTHTISVKRGGLIVTEGGALALPQLREWLKAAAKTTKQPVLLVIAGSEVTYADIVNVRTAAQDAGFVRIVWAGEPPPPPRPAGR